MVWKQDDLLRNQKQRRDLKERSIHINTNIFFDIIKLILLLPLLLADDLQLLQTGMID